MNKVALIFFLLFFVFEGSSQSLEEYQKIAAENNPGINARYKEFEAAMQQAAKINSLPDPKLSFGYFISPVETRVGPQVAKLSLTQMFPWFGTLNAGENAAMHLAEARYQSFIDSRNELLMKVAREYYALYELEEHLQLMTDNLKILESYKQLTTTKYENGQTSLVDVIRIEIMIEDANTSIEVITDKRAPTLARFNQLLNREFNEEAVVADTLSFMAPDIENLDSLLKDHPLLRELDLKASAMEERDKAIARQGAPSFGLGIDYVFVNERTDLNVPDNGKDAIMPMLTVSLPIFRGKYSSERKEASLLKEAYTLQKEETGNKLRTNLEMVSFEIERQLANIELYNTQVQRTRQALDLLFSSYSNNGDDFEELLRMQQKLLQYEIMSVTALVNLNDAMAELDYITAKTN